MRTLPNFPASPPIRGRTRHRSPHPRLYKQRIEGDSRNRTSVRFAMSDHCFDNASPSPAGTSDSEVDFDMLHNITRFKMHQENEQLKQEVDLLLASQGRNAKYDESTSFHLKTQAMADSKFQAFPHACTFRVGINITNNLLNSYPAQHRCHSNQGAPSSDSDCIIHVQQHRGHHSFVQYQHSAEQQLFPGHSVLSRLACSLLFLAWDVSFPEQRIC